MLFTISKRITAEKLRLPEGAYIDANWDTSIASPNAQYRRLQSEARWAIASAKDDRPAYDRVIKTFKALKKEVDAVVGEV